MSSFQSNQERIITTVIDLLNSNDISADSHQPLLNASIAALEGTITKDTIANVCAIYKFDESLCEDLIQSYSNLFWEVAKRFSVIPIDLSEKLNESGIDSKFAIKFAECFKENFETLKALKSSVSSGVNGWHFADLSWRLDLEVGNRDVC
mmetsp:Transcript_36300/g.36971  ORF Transcript_36300/g.36971 Transcript_36300/m.36971 type:complete len:150 (+) Transcript_36300:83-532(+)